MHAGGPGRPRKRPDHLLADEAYSTPAPGPCCAAAGSSRPSLNAPTSRPAGRRRPRRWAGPPAFDPSRYRHHNVVERCFNRLKRWRAIATRYAKRAALYRALLVIAATLDWLT